MLRSRNVDVPETRVARSLLTRLVRELQDQIREESSNAGNKTPAAEGRKRANSTRSKAATKAAAAKEEEEEATPTRPRRKSGAAAAKKAAAEEEEEATPTRPRRKSGAAAKKTAAKEEEEQEENEEQEAEPANKKRRSSVKPAAKRTSSAKPGKRSSKNEEEPEEPVEKRASSAGTPGKKRPAEKPAEEVDADDQEAKKPVGKKRRSSITQNAVVQPESTPAEAEPRRKSSPRRPSKKPEQPVQSAQPVQEQPAQPVQEQPTQPVQEQPEAAPAEPSKVGSFFTRVFSKLTRRKPSAPSCENEAAAAAPVPVDANEEPVPVGSTVSNEPVVDEVAMNGEPVVMEEKKKRIVVTPKLEIIAMSIGLALLVAFFSVFIGMSRGQSKNDVEDVVSIQRARVGVEKFLSGLNWEYARIKRGIELTEKNIDSAINEAQKEFEGSNLANLSGEELLAAIKEKNSQQIKEKLLKQMNWENILTVDDFELAEKYVNLKLESVGKVVKALDIKLKDAANAFEKGDAGIIVENGFVHSLGARFDIFTLSGAGYVLSVMWLPLLILLVIALLCVGGFFGYRFFKRYCDTLTSLDTIKDNYLAILKDQAIASNGQAVAQTGMENPSVMPAYVVISDLKKQAMQMLPVEEQKNLVVRFRMFRGLRSVKAIPSVRCGTTIVEGKTVGTLKWVGNTDSC